MIDGSASLQISSTTRTAASVAEALGIHATHMAEKGDARLSLEGNAIRGARPLYEYAVWSVTVDGDEASDDGSAGFTSLRLLVAQFAGKAQILSQLRESGEYKMYVSWYGTSGSSQGGFVLPLDLLAALVELGCDLFGNVYSYDPETEVSAPHRK
jgi:hypothetical protein